jgi:hypothetical protein
LSHSTIITETQNWIRSVVIGCNFCPFAAKAMLRNTIRYTVMQNCTTEEALDGLTEEFRFLSENDTIETSFLIFEHSFANFDNYLDIVHLAESVAASKSWKGIFQVAGFHPEYCFDGEDADDPANSTNRSMYPMFHILRERSITAAVEHFPNPDTIPERNIEYAQSKGLKYMELLRSSCFIPS